MSFRIPLDTYTITQGFGGNADYYRQFGQQGHNGIDLGANTGDPVYAADDGTVAFEGWGQNHSWMGTPAGICVLINHGGSYAGYAHLSDTVISKGQTVSKGQLIGHVGSTGAATGPHLHFEMLPLKPNFSNGFAGRINITPYIDMTKNATDDEIRQAYRDILEREADDSGIAHYRSYPVDFVRHDLQNSQEYRDLQARKAEAALDEANRQAEEAKKAADAKAAAEAQAAAQAELDRIAAEHAAAEEAAKAKSDQYAMIADNNRLLNLIWNAIKKIFNL